MHMQNIAKANANKKQKNVSSLLAETKAKISKRTNKQYITAEEYKVLRQARVKEKYIYMNIQIQIYVYNMYICT